MDESTSTTSIEEELFSRVERVRAKVGCLAADVTALETAATGQPEGELSASMRDAIEASVATLKKSGIEEHRDHLDELLTRNPSLERYAAEVEQLHCALDRVIEGWPSKKGTPSAAATIAACKATAERLDTARDRAAQLTVPREVGRRLEGMRVGKALDFNAEFGEELPNSERRGKVLAGLAPYEIGGAVDVKAGLIYKMSTNGIYRVFTYLAPLLAALAGAGLLVGIANLDGLGVDFPDDWDMNDAHQLIGAYLLLIAGAIAHLLVENVKEMQMRSVAVVAISDGLDWLHLRWVGISLTVVPILVTEIGLRVIGVQSGATAPGVYLLAGYSADSIAGLLLTRFDSAAGTWLKGIESEVKGVSSEGGGAG